VIIKSFVDAGRRVYEAGYDMIQIHASHNYLLSSFLSPFFNKRTDEYGGNTQNRTRILVEIYEQLRYIVDIPIIIKQQIKDFIPGGLDFEEGKEITRILVKTGYDALELSGGGAMVSPEGKGYPSIILKSKSDENYFLKQCEEIKSEMNGKPLICVGGIRDPFFAEKLIKENRVDFISICRPFIREPNLIKRWSLGDTSRPKCISCNDCFPTIFKKYAAGLHCAVEKRKSLKKLKK
jgi:2,4-dienoyl-CoA reductase-like NADH-dependent reductase (Old Yellow Enzyme family)